MRRVIYGAQDVMNELRVAQPNEEGQQGAQSSRPSQPHKH